MIDKGTPSSHATIYRISDLRLMRQQSPRHIDVARAFQASD
jgi:hypothetical protein